VHPVEPRLLTLLERRRLQSLPDTLELRGRTLRDQERMVGNAVSGWVWGVCVGGGWGRGLSMVGNAVCVWGGGGGRVTGGGDG
jgi:hypothetical protein